MSTPQKTAAESRPVTLGPPKLARVESQRSATVMRPDVQGESAKPRKSVR